MKVYFYLIPILIFCSCSQNNPNEITQPISVENVKSEIVDSLFNENENTAEIYEEVNLTTDVVKIEKEYGKQWDFCDCIYKTDSINKAIENSAVLNDQEVDFLFERFEAIDLRCKTIITGANNTPAERKSHERKVRKCKKSFGIK